MSTNRDNVIIMNKLAKNLRYLREKHGFKQGELATLCGWGSTPTRITNYESDKHQREPTLRDIEILAKVLQVSPHALAFDTIGPTEEYPAPRVSGFPILSWEEAKEWPTNKHSTLFADRNYSGKYLGEKIFFGCDAYALQIKDDSMCNFLSGEIFKKGAYIIVDPDEKHKEESLVIAKIGKLKEACFRKYVNDTGTLSLIPLNNNNRLKTISIDSTIVICGVVVAYIDIFEKKE